MALAVTMKGGGTDIERILSYSMDNHHLINPAGGHIFFVDGVNGDDNNLATDPTCPKLTFKDVLADCVVTNRKDTVVVLDYPWNTGVTGEDEPIAVTKNWITFLGVGTEEYKEPKIGVSTDAAAFDLQGAHRVTFKNLYINGGASHGCIEVTTYSSNLQVIDCKLNTFAPDAAAYGIWVNACAAPNMFVYRTSIGETAQGLIGTNGIEVSGVTANSTQSVVRECIFSGITGICVNLAATVGPGFKVLDSLFRVASDTVGKAITCADGNSGNLFDGNSANFGITAMATNPYRDLNNDNSNCWGRNYSGGIAVMPATG